MRKRLDTIYNNHSEHDLILNQHVIEKLGLVIDNLSFKLGNNKFPCVIYSTSMTRARLLAKIDEQVLRSLKNSRKAISLTYTFKVSNRKHNISFYVNAKIVFYEKYDCDREDIYFLSVDFINKPPDDLIDILGNHIEHQLTLQKRAIKRYTLSFHSEEDNSCVVDNYFFFSGKGKKCILTEISLFSAKILVSGAIGEFKENESSMLIMKSNKLKGLGEMMGYIGRVELINKIEGLYSIIIVFDQDVIPPGYKMWVVECMELIMNKPKQMLL